MADAWLTGVRRRVCGGGHRGAGLGIGLVRRGRSRLGLVSRSQRDAGTARGVAAPMREVAATLPALRSASANTASRGENTQTAMLPGTTDAVAAADLQERIQRMAATAGASLTAVETLPATTQGTWHKVTLRISLNAPWPVLMDLLRSVEMSPTRILVDDVHFHSATVVAHPTVMPVQASMLIYGFRSAQAGSNL